MEESVSPLTSIPTLRQLAMPKDTNALGTIFGGVILSQIDQAHLSATGSRFVIKRALPQIELTHDVK